MNKKLTLNKETISNLELQKTAAGKKITQHYSDCGTGRVTIRPCMCITEPCD